MYPIYNIKKLILNITMEFVISKSAFCNITKCVFFLILEHTSSFKYQEMNFKYKKFIFSLVN